MPPGTQPPTVRISHNSQADKSRQDNLGAKIGSVPRSTIDLRLPKAVVLTSPGIDPCGAFVSTSARS